MLKGLRERASSGHCCHRIGVLRLQGGLWTQPMKRIHWPLLSCRMFQVTGGHTGAQAVSGRTPAAVGGGNVCSLCHQCYFYSSLWTPWGLSLVKCFSLSEVTTITLIIIHYSSLLHNDTRLMSLTPTMFKYRAWNIKAYENFTVFTQYILFQGKNKYGEQAAFFSIASATFSINDYTNPQANKNNPLFSFWL